MSRKIQVTQVCGLIGVNKKQRASVKSLGLKKINSVVVLENTETVRGMINKVVHLVKIEIKD